MDPVTIRKGAVTDLPQVHKLVGELAEFEKAPEQFTATLADYRSDFEKGVFEIIVAEVKGEIAGMAFYYLTYSTWRGRMLYLEDFVVNEKYRGEGIGQKLFDAYLERAKEMNCKMVKWQVLDWNKGAIRFYERNNATIETEWLNGKIIF